jgi:N-acetylneuraminate epimerase
MNFKGIITGSCLTGLFILLSSTMQAQVTPSFSEFPALLDTEGMAGMFAGKSNGKLFCMGGANFPDKKPWEGGKKVWYDDIYMLVDDQRWIKLEQKLPTRLAYGISVEYRDEIIIVGGNDDKNFHSEVFGLKWNGSLFQTKKYPSLPIPLASMAGTIINNLIIVAGGNSGFTDPPLSICYALDLADPASGWVSMPTWPGPARAQAVSGSHNGSFFLFSGEGAAIERNGVKSRNILTDAYRFVTVQKAGKWTGSWESLPPLPKGVSASANPVPLLNQGNFVFWGGVDAESNVHKDPKQHPGIGKRIFVFNANTGIWHYTGIEEKFESRVTLPAIQWKDQWLYISGEIKPGIRTPKMVSVK